MLATTARLLAAALVAALSLASHASPAGAIPTDPQNPNLPRCLQDLRVPLLTATPRVVPLGQTSTLAWRVEVPAGCSTLTVKLNGQPVSRQASLRVTPMADTTYELTAWYPGQIARRIGALNVTVDLPSEVTINANHQVPLLRQALADGATTTVRVNNGVTLDLSGYHHMSIAPGVRLIGGRSPREAGPRLFTTTRLNRLFVVDGDNVRISGLRIEGPDMGVAEDGGANNNAIFIDSRNDVEISNNEIFGWKDSAIEVVDNAGRIHYATNPDTVRVRDNFIHHNEHIAKNGYGVVIGNGAYALIERNVFDWNRHAISGDGSDGSGYRAYRNLVLSHGGHHRWWFGVWQYTHQFDMHGQDSCNFEDRNCGTAGHDMDIRYNAFHYTEQEAIHLRGTPQQTPYGAYVMSNVFAHGNLGDAVKQNESGLYLALNRVGINGAAQLGSCDFDGDGRLDKFMATGQTWWYASPLTEQWTYLNASQSLLSELTLGQFDADNRCDVGHGSLISSGGTGPWMPRP